MTSYDGSYAGTRYFNALPGTGLFVTLDKLKPVSTFLSTINKKYENSYPMFDGAGACTSQEVGERLSRMENDIDLIELMGGSWPGQVNITNTEKVNKTNNNDHNTTATTANKYTRNKSLNIVSHLISNRKSLKPKAETFVSHVNSAMVKGNHRLLYFNLF